MKLKLVIREITGQHDRVGIVPPQATVLPVTTQVLSRSRLDAFPRALDVVGATRAVNQSERRSDRMVATENETIANRIYDRFHPFAIRLDACSAFIVEAATVNRAPEVCVELEIRDAPLALHC